jgi:hypothetical protein
LAHRVLDVVALARQGVKLGDVALVGQLALVKLLAAVLVDEVALVGEHHPAVLVDAAALLFDEEALVGDHHAGLAINVVEVAHQVVRVEIELFNAERSRHLAALIHDTLGEHDLVVHVLKNVASRRVSEVTALVGGLSVSILVVALGVSEHNNVTLLVTVKISENIVLVEKSEVVGWGHLNYRVGLLSEVLQRIVVDLNHSAVNVFFRGRRLAGQLLHDRFRSRGLSIGIGIGILFSKLSESFSLISSVFISFRLGSSLGSQTLSTFLVFSFLLGLFGLLAFSVFQLLRGELLAQLFGITFSLGLLSSGNRSKLSLTIKFRKSS